MACKAGLGKNMSAQPADKGEPEAISSANDDGNPSDPGIVENCLDLTCSNPQVAMTNLGVCDTEEVSTGPSVELISSSEKTTNKEKDKLKERNTWSQEQLELLLLKVKIICIIDIDLFFLHYIRLPFTGLIL